MIDWSDPKAKISKYFTVGEATWLPSWGKYHVPSEQECANILKLAQAMDKVREIVKSPIKVHVWIRPEGYNKQIGGAVNSAHITGEAVDWDCMQPCDETRTRLITYLGELGLRMEDLPGSTWVHLDIRPPGANGHRFFRP